MTKIKLCELSETAKEILNREGIEDWEIDADGCLWLHSSEHDMPANTNN